LARTRVVAHRGASGLVPHGNTPEAFDAAVSVGARWAEIDVRRTSDGSLVVHHDPCIGDVPLARMSLDDARRASDRQGRVLLTLGELLARWGEALCFDVELKEPGTEADTVRCVRAHLPPERTVYTSFVDASVARIRRLAPDTDAGLLLGLEAPTSRIRTRLSELFPARRARACDATFVAPNVQLVRAGFLDRMRLAGLPVWVWTVNDPSALQRLIRAGASAVVTDRPDIGLGIIGGLAA
jgi:glycerophosphoryl diester phosphodiesterase